MWCVYADFRKNGVERREIYVPLKWGNYPVQGGIFVPLLNPSPMWGYILLERGCYLVKAIERGQLSIVQRAIAELQANGGKLI